MIDERGGVLSLVHAPTINYPKLADSRPNMFRSPDFGFIKAERCVYNTESMSAMNC